MELIPGSRAAAFLRKPKRTRLERHSRLRNPGRCSLAPGTKIVGVHPPVSEPLMNLANARDSVFTLPAPRLVPVLDPSFRPASLATRTFRKELGAHPPTIQLAL